MAKQNVTFVERHMEKLIAAVAGAVLLVVAALYLFNTPNKFQLPGLAEPLAPEDYYAGIKQEAEALRQRMNTVNSSDEDSDGSIPPIPPIKDELKPLPVAGLPERFPVPFAPPRPEIAITGQGPLGGKIELAEILPVSKPLVTTGHDWTRLPIPEETIVGASIQLQEEQLPIIQAHQWVSIFAVVDRESQWTKFKDAGYDNNKLIIADVEIQRQQRQYDGQWGTPQIIQSYRPIRLIGERNVTLEEQEGRLVVNKDGLALIQAYQTELGSSESQSEILRPDFQGYLESDPLAWQVPKSFPGFDDIDWKNYNILLDTGDSKDDAKRGKKVVDRPGAFEGPISFTGEPSGTTGVVGEAAEKKQLRDDFKAAQDALDKEEWLKAKELLEKIKSSSAATADLVKKSEALLTENQQNFDLAEHKQRIEEKLQQTRASMYLGPEHDPLWAIDTGIVPGEVYRYRVRLLVLNHYAGRASSLANPQEAAKVIIPGQWSEWSEAIYAKPDKRIFFKQVKQMGRATMAAIVEIYDWSTGKWNYASDNFKIGQPIAFTKTRRTYGYDAIVVDVDSDVLALVDYNGRIEERVAGDELQSRKKFRDEQKEEEDRIERSANRVQPRPMPRQPRERRPSWQPGRRDRHGRDFFPGPEFD